MTAVDLPSCPFCGEAELGIIQHALVVCPTCEISIPLSVWIKRAASEAVKDDDPMIHELIVECERAMKQRDEFLRTGERTGSNGGGWDTCFRFIINKHLPRIAGRTEVSYGPRSAAVKRHQEPLREALQELTATEHVYGGATLDDARDYPSQPISERTWESMQEALGDIHLRLELIRGHFANHHPVGVLDQYLALAIEHMSTDVPAEEDRLADLMDPLWDAMTEGQRDLVKKYNMAYHKGLTASPAVGRIIK